MGLEAGLLADERHIYEGLALQKGVERRQQMILVVVPAQVVVWRPHFMCLHNTSQLNNLTLFTKLSSKL